MAQYVQVCKAKVAETDVEELLAVLPHAIAEAKRLCSALVRGDVRRSVANHLNDMSKDHPDVALELRSRWVDRSDGGAWIARHGLRSLIKRGDIRALDLVGALTP